MLRTFAGLATCLAYVCPVNADFFTLRPPAPYDWCPIGALNYDGSVGIGYCVTPDPNVTPETFWWTREGGITFNPIDETFEPAPQFESRDGTAKLIPGVGVERADVGLVTLPGYGGAFDYVLFSDDGNIAYGSDVRHLYSRIWVWNPASQAYDNPYPEIEAAVASFGVISGDGRVLTGSTFYDQVVFDLGTLLPPDVTADGMVAMDDFDVLRNGMNDPVDPMRAPFLQGDLNHSEAVGLDDFILFREYWHSEVMAGVVPEPSTWILAILAVLFVLGVTLCPRPKSTAGR